MTRDVAIEVEVDEARCMAIGNCVLSAPAVFDQSEEEGTVVLLDATPPADEHDRVREAASLCPASVISLHRTASGDQPRVTAGERRTDNGGSHG
ncbi:ferredoxin [Lentzea sp. NPDC059081]|uniref:ferredoxin n=1 Tax=Lentzea sp. NPDC059081 TaxID=3346719 RepID=UPI0036A2EAEE